MYNYIHNYDAMISYTGLLLIIYIVVYYMYTCIDKTLQIVLERGSIDARVLSTGGGGGQGGSFPPKMSILPPPNIFI